MENVLDHPIIRNMENTGYPDGKEPKVMFFCADCKHEIFVGEEYYDIGGKKWCEDCVEDARKTAEY